MDPLIWLALPMIVAIGSATVSYYAMRCRMEVAIAKEREALAQANAELDNLRQSVPDKLRAAEESARLRAMDSLLSDFRVEERRFVRGEVRPSLVLQERLFFRNIPLSSWVEHDFPLRDGTDLRQFDSVSVFSAQGLSAYTPQRLISN